MKKYKVSALCEKHYWGEFHVEANSQEEAEKIVFEKLKDDDVWEYEMEVTGNEQELTAFEDED